MRILYKFGAKFKPILKKIIPHKLLRNIKAKLVQYETNKLNNVKLNKVDSKKYLQGINLIGYIKHDTGLGQSTRLLAKSISHSNIPFVIKDYSPTNEYVATDETFDEILTGELKYQINIFHINAHEFTIAYKDLGKSAFDGHYNIAYWLWEMQDFPDKWLPCINILDEIWTPSEFISQSIRKKTNKPVCTIPYSIEAPTSEEYDRNYFKLPKDKFLFLGMYDSNSVSERKNPKGIIEAYKKAFPIEKNDVGLVLKINHVEKKELDEIKKALKNYNNIYLLLDNMKKIEVNTLIKCVNVYISLHRAEGFGLVLAEAMLLGTPTVATNYSANTEFQDKNTACLVDYELVKLNEDIGLYSKNDYWANPDVNQASEYIYKLYSDKDFYESIKNNAQEKIANDLSITKTKEIIEQRYREIQNETT